MAQLTNPTYVSQDYLKIYPQQYTPQLPRVTGSTPRRLTKAEVEKAYKGHYTPLGWTSKIVKTTDGRTQYHYTGLDENGKTVTHVFDEGVPNATSSNNTGASTGGANYSVPAVNNYYAVPEVQKVNWQGKSTDELAELLGLETYKTADILQLYNNATNKKFDELDTQTKRAQAENLRTLEGQYENYLNTIREDRANAVANGMTKGMNAANQIATMYANAANINENQQAYSDALYDLGEQRATSLEENAITAYQDRKSIEQYLASAAAQYEANSVNELAAKLAASAQVQAARTTADANIKAAGINYNAANAAQNMDWLVPYIVNAQKGDTVSQKILDIVQAHYGAN